ncbi:hypothetical protein [Coleofasciculus sp. FACHB-T130]|uniref:hypothetical protein n=1 Tax=Cyanophyceae TaxID=3028117 RepID=UPI001682B17C|nr:hypothetical protein [Coleofasciculus sp. FACHB-T130]MBD1878152.1 hypothetical protein [Coleofasciculus sp. FACHB-T130]
MKARTDKSALRDRIHHIKRVRTDKSALRDRITTSRECDRYLPFYTAQARSIP